MHPIWAAENGRKRGFVQNNPILSVFFLKPSLKKERLVVTEALYG